jgi:tetratricopeptide (TPR) repeat protein
MSRGRKIVERVGTSIPKPRISWGGSSLRKSASPWGLIPALLAAVLVMSSLEPRLVASQEAGAEPQPRHADDPRTVLRFVERLRGKGYHDLALEYLSSLREAPGLPADLATVIDYERGRTLIDEAAQSADTVRRRERLDEAKTTLEAFAKAHSDNPLARDALVQIARILVERGHLAVYLAEETENAAEKDARIAEARAAFDQAREAYSTAIKRLDTEYKTFAGFIPENDPRREQRDKVYIDLLDAQLQKAEVDFEQALTFPAGAPERAERLNTALSQFDDLHLNYRETLAGLTARMWQAKCYEEQGKIDEAIGLYKELMTHADPRLRALQRHVSYFYIVALGKRKQYALAGDEANRWLELYNRPQERNTPERIGVLFELAKDIEAQLPGAESVDRATGIKKIIDTLREVVRYASPYKAEALTLLRKYKPSAAVRAEEIARLSLDELMSQTETALAEQDWDRAITLGKAAIRKAESARSIDKINLARYQLAFAHYAAKHYYEAFVIADHLAHRYPQGGLSPRATEIGMQSLAEAYNTYREVDRASDLDRLADLARYTITTWPDRESANVARVNLGQLELGRGRYAEAIEALASVPNKSARWAEAQTSLGGAHWFYSRALERQGHNAAAEKEATAARTILQAALESRRAAGTAPTDPRLVGNACDLALVLTETGQPADALKLLEPIVQAQTVRSGATYSRLMESLLLAHVAANQVDQAIATMGSLEKAGEASAQQTQNYLKLGRLIQSKIDDLKQKGDQAGLSRMNKSFETFLTTLANTKTGQTFESLLWAGESLLSIDRPKEAEAVLRRLLDESIKSPEFLARADSEARLLRVRLRLASSLTAQGASDASRFGEAASLLEEIRSKTPNALELLVEEGMLLEARAAAGKGDWSAAFKHWQGLALRLSRARPKPTAYYDAWYHAAFALKQDGQGAKARQALAGVMRLSPGVGGPEMKARYQKLLSQIK